MNLSCDGTSTIRNFHLRSGTQIVVNPCEPLKNQTDKCFKKGKENYKHFV